MSNDHLHALEQFLFDFVSGFTCILVCVQTLIQSFFNTLLARVLQRHFRYFLSQTSTQFVVKMTFVVIGVIVLF